MNKRQTVRPDSGRIWGKRLLTGVLVLMWMFVIGSFSAQTGGESGNLSTKAADKVVLVEEWVKGKAYPETERRMKIQRMQFPIRKLAHMTEYACLGLLLVWHLGTYFIENERSDSFEEMKESLTCKGGQQGSRVREKRGNIRLWLQKGNRRFPLAFGIAVLYAAADEFHQRFVPGRSGQLRDVCIDGAGALLGVLMCWGIWKIRNHNAKKID